MRLCVWFRNLKNEEAMARVGPQRHGGGGLLHNNAKYSRKNAEVSTFHVWIIELSIVAVQNKARNAVQLPVAFFFYLTALRKME